MHLLGTYLAPIVKDVGDKNNGKYFGFRGDRMQPCGLQLIQLTTDKLLEIKAKTRTGEEIMAHFNGETPPPPHHSY